MLEGISHVSLVITRCDSGVGRFGDHHRRQVSQEGVVCVSAGVLDSFARYVDEVLGPGKRGSI